MSLPKPITRKDKYYSYLATGEGEIPDPVTRQDRYLHYLCRNGTAGGGGGNTAQSTIAFIPRQAAELPLQAVNTADIKEEETTWKQES